MQRVGIYSGAFDPVHEGHMAFAHQALVQCGLDKVFFLVEPRPRRKQGVKALEHRAEMVRLAVRSEPRLGVITLDQQRFTPADTLPVLRARFKGAALCMLMGDDVLGRLADWPHVRELIQDVEFGIGTRRHSESEVRQRLQHIQRVRGLGMECQIFQVAGPDISSARVRRQLRAGQQPSGLVPQVLQYIRSEGLYSAVAAGLSTKS